ncbi:MAG TPA: NAD(P)H-hydrate dehydratase [Acidobacteriota bacterium]|nr:NAD(P)H-hydrate dehydratase [Acidobacteriota bacterium]
MKPYQLPRIVTPTQMQAIDRRAIEGMGIPGLTLMENAGRGIAERIRDQVLGEMTSGAHVAIVCGRGNNGGDGFVIARHLAEAHTEITILLLGSLAQLKGDALVNAERAQEMGLTIRELADDAATPDLDHYDLLVDAIFGTGFRGPISGLASAVIEAMNGSGVRIVAVDSPSGLDGTTGAAAGTVVDADFTMTLAAYKRGQWLWPGRGLVGKLEEIDIGIPREAVDKEQIALALVTEEFICAALPERPPDGHKGIFGKAMIIGGSAGMSGAVALAANAAMHTGVGLTFAGVPASVVDAVDVNAIEAVVRPLPEVRQRRALARRGLGEIARYLKDVDAVAIGPGLGMHHETQELVRRLVQRRTRPTVLDADGLNACAKDPAVLEDGNDTPLIITPHAAEMARLLGRTTADIVDNREEFAREAAARFGCVAVMKGAPTFVADLEGNVYLNPTGNAGMASGGVGDVLTGIIVSFLAQGCDPLVAALLGVYLHGLAGDYAAAEVGERSLVASDLITALPDVLVHLEG